MKSVVHMDSTRTKSALVCVGHADAAREFEKAVNSAIPSKNYALKNS
jgi:hypothetical protein